MSPSKKNTWDDVDPTALKKIEIDMGEMFLQDEEVAPAGSNSDRPKIRPSLSRNSLYSSVGLDLDSGVSVNNTQRMNSIFAQSIIEKVANSWELLAANKVAVGQDFFTRVLTANPKMLKLFSFGAEVTGDPETFLRNCPALRMHATTVMNFIGKGVNALAEDDIDGLIPDLRALGKTHVRMGVCHEDYEKYFTHLMAAFAAELGTQWNKETAKAWGNIYHGMTTVMDAPEQLNQTEPLVGWGLCIAVANAFIAFVSPLRLAGFLVTIPLLARHLLDLVEILAAIVLVGDLISPWIVQQMTAGKSQRKTKRPGFLHSTLSRVLSPFKYRIFHTVMSLHLELWVPWPKLDATILLSYVLQNLTCWADASATLYATGVGVSWLHILGLVRVAAILRVSYFARCAENAAILRHKTTENFRGAAIISNLVFTLTYVTHVSACVWCIVARVEHGPGATKAVGSEFFPDETNLLGESGVMLAYLRSVYWAWANLAGIGNVESVPLQPLEICATLLVHIVGATLYAIVTGNVVAILEEATQKENRIGDDLSGLRAFMDECGMSPEAQKRIMHGYVVQNLMQSHGDDDETVPELDGDVARRLPSHYRQDLELHARSVALQRRNPCLENCSNDFLFALANAMPKQVTLLPGDYLLEAGEKASRRFCMVEKGSFEIIRADECIGTLQRGCAVGVGWLVESTLPVEARYAFSEPCELSDWLLSDGTAAVSIRSTTDCVVVSGLPSPLEVEALHRRFPGDFEVLDDLLHLASCHTPSETKNDSDKDAGLTVDTTKGKKSLRGLARSVGRSVRHLGKKKL